MKRVEWLDGAKAAHARLLADLDGLDDGAVRAACLLPHWSRGHLLTHLARNADSNTGIFLAAQRGEVVPQYPGGVEQRSGDIDAGAGRSAAELAIDVAVADCRLWRQRGRAPEEVWSHGRGRS